MVYVEVALCRTVVHWFSRTPRCITLSTYRGRVRGNDERNQGSDFVRGNDERSQGSDFVRYEETLNLLIASYGKCTLSTFGRTMSDVSRLAENPLTVYIPGTGCSSKASLLRELVRWKEIQMAKGGRIAATV